jgi:hypothetical protein
MDTEKMYAFGKWGRLLAMSWIALFALTAAACGGGDGDEDCNENQVEVTYLGTSNDRVECKPIPAECSGVGDCGVNECVAAMYGLCEAPAFGVGCSDTFPPTIISCNES